MEPKNCTVAMPGRVQVALAKLLVVRCALSVLWGAGSELISFANAQLLEARIRTSAISLTRSQIFYWRNA